MNTHSSKNSIATLVLILSIMCFSISTYQTLIGFRLATGDNSISWLFAFMILLGLIITSLLLWQNVQKDTSVGKLAILLFCYLVIATFSFAANFNAFYSEYMKNELLYNEIEKLQSDLISLQSKCFQAIDKSSNAKEIEENVELYKTTLILQILDTATPGFGEKAKLEAAKIEKILGVELTIPSGTPNILAASFEKQISQLLEKKIELLTKESHEFKEKIKVLITNLQNEFDNVKMTRDIDQYKAIIASGIKAYNNIGEEVYQFTGVPKDFSFNRLTASTQEIGKISHSFSSAMEKQNRKSAVVPLMLSLLVDLLVPVIIILMRSFYKPGEVEKKPVIFPVRQEEKEGTGNDNSGKKYKPSIDKSLAERGTTI